MKVPNDGLYLFYVIDGEAYPVVISENDWELLQSVGNLVAGRPIRVVNKPMGKVYDMREVM